MGNKLNGPHPHPREPVKQILTQPDNGILYSCEKEGGPSSRVLIQKEFQDIGKVKQIKI